MINDELGGETFRKGKSPISYNEKKGGYMSSLTSKIIGFG